MQVQLKQISPPYRSSGSTSVCFKREVGEAIVAEFGSTWGIPQGKLTRDKLGYGFYLHCEGWHGAIAKTLWKVHDKIFIARPIAKAC